MASKIQIKDSSAALNADTPVSIKRGTTDHTQLSNRDAKDQHPISAITGLEEKINNTIHCTKQELTDKQKQVARNNISALDMYNGMTRVECVFPPWFNGGEDRVEEVYLAQGSFYPIDYKNVSDDVKNMWRSFEFSLFDYTFVSSVLPQRMKNFAALIKYGVFGQDFFNTVDYDHRCILYDNPITKNASLQLYAYKKGSSDFVVRRVGPNGFSFTAKYSIETNTFSNEYVDYASTYLRKYASKVGDPEALSQVNMDENPTDDMQIATKKYVDDTVSSSMDITGAAVGQIAKITAVDTDGKPAAWEPVDMPGGSAEETWELVQRIPLRADVSEYVLGSLAIYKKIRMITEEKLAADYTGNMWFLVKSASTNQNVCPNMLSPVDKGYRYNVSDVWLDNLFANFTRLVSNNLQTFSLQNCMRKAITLPAVDALVSLYLPEAVLSSLTDGAELIIYGVKA